RHRGILQTSLSLRVRKVAADAPFQRLVSEAYFWRLVFDGWRTNSSASWAPFLPRFQLIDDSVISREQSFSRKDESVRQCVQLAFHEHMLTEDFEVFRTHCAILQPPQRYVALGASARRVAPLGNVGETCSAFHRQLSRTER